MQINSGYCLQRSEQATKKQTQCIANISTKIVKTLKHTINNGPNIFFKQHHNTSNTKY